MSQKTGRRKGKSYSTKYMRSYIDKNMKSALAKLKRMENSGVYKVSKPAQDAKAHLRMLARKYGYDEERLTSSQSFRSSITSYADIGTLFRAINDIQSENVYSLKIKLKRVTSEFENTAGVSFNESFNLLSYISSEFHEIFAFITYNEVQTELEEGKVSTLLDILNEYRNTANSKYISLNEKQERYRQVMEKKLETKLSSSETLALQNMKNLKWGK